MVAGRAARGIQSRGDERVGVGLVGWQRGARQPGREHQHAAPFQLVGPRAALGTRSGRAGERSSRRRGRTPRRRTAPGQRPPGPGRSGRAPRWQSGQLTVGDLEHACRDIDPGDLRRWPPGHGSRREGSRSAPQVEDPGRSHLHVCRDHVEHGQRGRPVDGGPPSRISLRDPVVARLLVRHTAIVPCWNRALRPTGAVRGPLSVGGRMADASGLEAIVSLCQPVGFVGAWGPQGARR